MQLESLVQVIEQTLITHEEWDVVCRRDVVDAHDLFGANVTEHRDFLHRSRQEWFLASTSDLRCQLMLAE